MNSYIRPLARPLTAALGRPLFTASLLAAPLLATYRTPLIQAACNSPHFFNTSAPTMSSASSTSFLDAVKARRSVYAINKNAPVADARVHEIVDAAMLNVPSAFNLQPIRAVVLFNDEHDKFWQAASQASAAGSPDDEAKQRGEERINGFAAGSGTILFWTDDAVTKGAQAKMPMYGHFFPEWAQQSQGMHQYVLWAALEAEGFGASLQHYQFLGPDFVQGLRERYALPADYELSAQLVFGGRGEGGVKAKQMKELSETVKVFGAK